MAQTKRLIFKVNQLEKKYGSYDALKLKKLEVHPGTIYGVVGTVGSGKTTLLNILAGVEKQSGGTILYENNEYETNWFGKIIPKDDIFYNRDPQINTPNKTVASYVSTKFGNKKRVIENRYFSDGSFKNLWNRNMKEISDAELNWLGMILAIEADPRVLLIDDYGAYFNNKMEKDFRSKIIKMNRTLGTTIIMTAPSDVHLKHFASVLIFLDHGHIWKIRSGNTKPNNNSKNSRSRRSRSNNRNRKRRN